MIPLILGILLAGSAWGQVVGQGQLDASPSLFSVLAALNAAGYDAESQSASNSPVRQIARQALGSRNLASIEELRRFVRDHRQENDTALLSLYISFGLCVDGPPNFRYRLRRNDLPPEVAALEGLPDLMKRFHQEAGIDELWKQAQPEIDRMIARYHQPLSEAVLQANGYMRNPTSGLAGRRFQVFVDVLGAPNQVHTRLFGDEYFVVVTPSAEPAINEIRHAYLQYLADPLTLRHAEAIEKKKGLGDFAQPAPLLASTYKQDFNLLFQKCLVKAIETRLLSGPGTAAKRQQMVEQALAEGYILTPYFAEALAAYEKQEQSLRLYFPDLINGIDLEREDKRLENVQFASAAARKTRPAAPQQAPPPATGAEKMLEDAETRLEAKGLAEARSLFLQVLPATDDKRLQAKAYYGLARIAIRENDPELGERLFQRTLELEPEPVVKAWSLVYLGRLADIAGESDQAAAHYKAALEVKGASEKAAQTAEQGLRGAFRRKTQ